MSSNHILSFLDQTLWLLFFCCSFLCGYYSRQRLFPWKAHRHQLQLDKARISDAVMIVRCCQYYAQPLSSAVSRENKSYNLQ